MSDSIGKPWPAAALPIGWAGVGESHPAHTFYTPAVSGKVSSGVRKGCGTHPSLRDDFIDQSVHTEQQDLLQTQCSPLLTSFFCLGDNIQIFIWQCWN